MPDHNINFLVVDSDPALQALLQSTIHSSGYGRVAAVNDVREALVVLATGVVDFIICDWSNANGPELGLLKLLKAQEVYKYIPFLVTARPQKTVALESEHQRRVTAARGDGYLAKPIETEALKRSLEEILARFPSL